MRRLLIGSGLIVLVVSLSVCTASSGAPSEEGLQRKADLWEIDQIEKNFHKATTTQDLELMLSLWAPNATMTVGPGQTATGREEIRRFWLEEAAAFEPENHWISDHPAFKVEITVNGDRGTLHFECHYIDAETGKLAIATVADMDVARIGGRWLITNMVGGSTTLTT
jgi:ketosteroid isomerase-like protein